MQERLDGFGRCVRQDHRELVAADAGGVVADPQHLAEALAELAERRVAGLMALGVVDDLQPVDVDHHERELPAVAVAAGDGHVEQAVELRRS